MEGDPKKALGPDGFTFVLFQKSRDLIKDDLWEVIDDFYKGASLSRKLIMLLSHSPKEEWCGAR